jgi:hypothetical protein
MRLQMAANARFVEWLHPQAEVIKIARFLAGRRTASFAEFAIDGYQINDRSTSAQLDQANFVLPSFYGAPEGTAVEAKHAVEVYNAQYKVIDFANMDHRVGLW